MIVIEKTYVIPVITAVRPTCIGMQYTLETPEYIDVVTVADASISCTCGEGQHCPHIQVVHRQVMRDTEKNTRRSLHTSLFGL